jgi:hypothetical protein
MRLGFIFLVPLSLKIIELGQHVIEVPSHPNKIDFWGATSRRQIMGSIFFNAALWAPGYQGLAISNKI